MVGSCSTTSALGCWLILQVVVGLCSGFEPSSDSVGADRARTIQWQGPLCQSTLFWPCTTLLERFAALLDASSTAPPVWA